MLEANELFNSAIPLMLAGENVPVPDFWSPEVEITNFEPSPFPGTYRGHEGLFKWAQDFLGDFDEGRVDVVDVEERGNLIAAKLQMTGRGHGSGIPVTLVWGALFEMRDGRCVRISADSDYERALQRLRDSVG